MRGVVGEMGRRGKGRPHQTQLPGNAHFIEAQSNLVGCSTGGGEPLVREAQRPGNGAVNGSERGGQLLFLPLLAMLAEQYGWQAISIVVTLAVAAMLPIVALLMPESPAQIGLAPFGATVAVRPPRVRATRSPSP